jgi:hypothetical protein
MSRAPDKDVDDAQPAPASEPAGKVEFDSRGNSVWRWARDVLESTSVLLKRLDNKDLALEPTQKVPVVRAAEQRSQKSGGRPQVSAEKDRPNTKASHPAMQRERRRDGSGGGFDPYNSR